MRNGFSSLQKAAAAFSLYGIILLTGAALHSFQAGDFGDIHRVAIRFLVVCFIAYGLWNHEQWAWWFGVVASVVIILFGLSGVFLGLAVLPDIVAQGINPTLDLVLLGASFFLMGLTVRYLLMNTSRELVRNSQ